MKTIKQTALFFIAPIIVAPLIITPAYASPKKSNLNGKPFKILTDLIENNAAIIASNTESISLIQNEITLLNQRINVTEQQIVALTQQTQINQNAINQLLNRINQTDTNLTSLRHDLIDQNNATIQLGIELQQQLELTDTNIKTLINSNSQLIEDLQLMLLGIQNQVDTNTGSINPLSNNVAMLLVQATSNTNNIALLQNERNTLAEQINTLDNTVNDIQQALTNTNNRIAALQRLHQIHYDFETGAQGWTVANDSQTVIGNTSIPATWLLSNIVPGTTGQPLPSTGWVIPNSGHLGPERSHVTSPIHIANDTVVSITFDSYSANEGGYPNLYDVEHVQVAVNGEEFFDVHGSDQRLHSSNNRTFHTITFDVETGINPGDEFQIRFLLDTGDGCCGAGSISGWAVDNVIINGAR